MFEHHFDLGVAMTTVHASEIISVWTEQAVPARLVWRGDRCLITDTATLLHESFDHDALTYSARRIIGWRFQGRSVNDGSTRVFDARQITGTRWERLGVYT